MRLVLKLETGPGMFTLEQFEIQVELDWFLGWIARYRNEHLTAPLTQYFTKQEIDYARDQMRIGKERT